MKQKIDNDKMWASIISCLEEQGNYIQLWAIRSALKDQGLQYNPETKEIESIEQPSEHKLVEAVANEPVEQKPKFKVGDLIKPFIFQNHYGTHQRRIVEIRDRYYFTSIYNEKLSIDDVDSCFGLIEKNEEPELNHSEVTKESDKELTEFESKLRFIIDNNPSGINFKVLSRELLSIARKQLQPEFDAEIEQAYKNQDEVVYNKGYEKAIEEAVSWLRDQLMNKYQNGILQCLRDDRAAFILGDFRKALEKGE